MWRPSSLGEQIAERVCDLGGAEREGGRVTITFGRPVRASHPQPTDPWWCPVRIVGPELDLFQPISGTDSRQALDLALAFAADVVPEAAADLSPADRAGPRTAGLLARQMVSYDPDNPFTALYRRLQQRSVAEERQDPAPLPVAAVVAAGDSPRKG